MWLAPMGTILVYNRTLSYGQMYMQCHYLQVVSWKFGSQLLYVKYVEACYVMFAEP